MKIAGIIFERLESDFKIFVTKEYPGKVGSLSDKQKQKLLRDYEKTVVSSSIMALCEEYPNIIEQQLSFSKGMSGNFRKQFQYFQAYLHVNTTVYNRMQQHFLAAKPANKKLNLIFPLYGYLTRQASQIFTLLLNGYPDGSLRLWRSLYEFAVIELLFIKEYTNENLQRQFIDHFQKAQKKKTDSHQKHYVELKHPPLEDSLINFVKTRSDTLSAQYGKTFLEEDYGWCSVIFPSQKKKVTFRDIEEYVGLSRLRPYYIWASGHCHPSFESFMEFYNADKKILHIDKILLPEIEKASYIDPLQLTLAVLDEVNRSFLELYSVSSEADINWLLFRTIHQKLQNEFRRKHKPKADKKSGG